jgi:hypothetical protein
MAGWGIGLSPDKYRVCCLGRSVAPTMHEGAWEVFVIGSLQTPGPLYGLASAL